MGERGHRPPGSWRVASACAFGKQKRAFRNSLPAFFRRFMAQQVRGAGAHLRGVHVGGGLGGGLPAHDRHGGRRAPMRPGTYEPACGRRGEFRRLRPPFRRRGPRSGFLPRGAAHHHGALLPAEARGNHRHGLRQSSPRRRDPGSQPRGGLLLGRHVPPHVRGLGLRRMHGAFQDGARLRRGTGRAFPAGCRKGSGVFGGAGAGDAQVHGLGNPVRPPAAGRRDCKQRGEFGQQPFGGRGFRPRVLRKGRRRGGESQPRAAGGSEPPGHRGHA